MCFCLNNQIVFVPESVFRWSERLFWWAHVHLCVNNTSIVSFWWLPLARIAYVDGFVHEMSRGAAHAFLYGLNVLFAVFSGSCSSAFNEITFFYKIKNTILEYNRAPKSFFKKCFYQNRFKIARFNRDILIFGDFLFIFSACSCTFKIDIFKIYFFETF